jgi:Fe-S-cluster containining protein
MSGCTQCGACCLKFGYRLEAFPGDIAKWLFEGRDDILSHVKILYDENDEVSGGILWVDENGDRVQVCPFLKLSDDNKYYCGIQDIKPEVCTWHYCEKYYIND